MNKTLALIALLGLVSAPAFANETNAAPAAAPVKAEKVVVKDGKEEAKKDEAKKDEAAAEAPADAKAAPKAEEKK